MSESDKHWARGAYRRAAEICEQWVRSHPESKENRYDRIQTVTCALSAWLDHYAKHEKAQPRDASGLTEARKLLDEYDRGWARVHSDPRPVSITSLEQTIVQLELEVRARAFLAWVKERCAAGLSADVDRELRAELAFLSRQKFNNTELMESIVMAHAGCWLDRDAESAEPQAARRALAGLKLFSERTGADRPSHDFRRLLTRAEQADRLNAKLANLWAEGEHKLEQQPQAAVAHWSKAWNLEPRPATAKLVPFVRAIVRTELKLDREWKARQTKKNCNSEDPDRPATRARRLVVKFSHREGAEEFTSSLSAEIDAVDVGSACDCAQQKYRRRRGQWLTASGAVLAAGGAYLGFHSLFLTRRAASHDEEPKNDPASVEDVKDRTARQVRPINAAAISLAAAGLGLATWGIVDLAWSRRNRSCISQLSWAPIMSRNHAGLVLRGRF